VVVLLNLKILRLEGCLSLNEEYIKLQRMLLGGIPISTNIPLFFLLNVH